MKRILVADDDRHVLYLISEVLTRSDYEVSQAADGDQALEMARSTKPDIIILDIMMPGLDGIEVCRAVKSDPATAGIRVIMVTAKSGPQDIEAGREAGADHYITKPFRLAELVGKIAELVG
ncbi:MAG TPA: hypothetical protein DDW31_06675 [candidate division Zixibacteria bacterium]|jgi:CheY-like chemotaxis protein|nr:hypothetical protein [candidate division Zixibacteria bacterium]